MQSNQAPGKHDPGSFKQTQDYYNQRRPEMLRFVPVTAKTLLEIGCGEGWFGSQIKQRQTCAVWGMEIKPEAGRQAGKKLDKIIIGDMTRLWTEVPDDYFDCVIANDVLEHLLDPFSALRVLRTKLKTTGVLVCSLPNVRYWGVLKDLLLHKQWRYTEGYILDKSHVRFFTEKSIRQMIEDAGYNILQLQGINGIKSFKLKLLTILTLGNLSDARYFQFACVASPALPREGI
jgi:2-polyprenyl-3-methyl-5-hydroxy-6-metoxy-1,4-benzoquinol methylase